MAEPLVVQSYQELPALRVVGEAVRALATGEATGSYEVFVQSGEQGIGPPPHHHPWDESFFVLEGAIDVIAGDRSVTLERGGFVHLPSGTLHAYRTRSAHATLLSIASCAGASRFFAEMDRDASELPPVLPKVLEVAARNRLTIVVPE